MRVFGLPVSQIDRQKVKFNNFCSLQLVDDFTTKFTLIYIIIFIMNICV